MTAPMVFAKTALRVRAGLATKRIPMATPPMVTNSETCMRTSGLPPAIMKPPRVAPMTIMNPMIRSMDVRERRGEARVSRGREV